MNKVSTWDWFIKKCYQNVIQKYGFSIVQDLQVEKL
jgi:hypothetical protein